MSILDEIVRQRKKDLAEKGSALGFSIPAERTRKPPVPFIAQKGAVLEIKRASPSKGDIAPELDAAATAAAYASAGASAISVLTEQRWFKGSLSDLLDTCRAVDDYAAANKTGRIAVLRKDFLLFPEEIDIAYRAGADAVLLISRILSDDELVAMAKRTVSYGMTAFIELRLESDLEKLAKVSAAVGTANIVCGVNARDLSDFSIDLLTPCTMLSKIQALLGNNARVIFESGIRTPDAAWFAGSLGFTGMLLGEAAARNPAEAAALVRSFVEAPGTKNAVAWLQIAPRIFSQRYGAKSECAHAPQNREPRPFIKVCGLTTVADALYATMGGADFLGFIFCKKSPRNVDVSVISAIKKIIREEFNQGNCQDEHIFAAGNYEEAPKLVGVITDCTSQESRAAIGMVADGTLDFLQVHGECAIKDFFADKELRKLPHFCVVNISSEADLAAFDALRQRGEPRIMVDAKTDTAIGGTGLQIARPLIQKIKEKTRLWLAGGICPGNVEEIIRTCSPELIDVNSGVESAPGKKDEEKLLSLFTTVDQICSS